MIIIIKVITVIAIIMIIKMLIIMISAFELKSYIISYVILDLETHFVYIRNVTLH